MLPLQWLLTGAAVLVAVAALVKARRLSKRVDRLTESYWELKYQHGELRVQLQRAAGTTPPDPPAPVVPAGNSFIPLTALKR